MNDEVPSNHISVAALAEIDSSYVPFADIDEWAEVVLADNRWRHSLELLERERAESPNSVDIAVERAVRAAAFDTGAIEGLYETDRGFTLTVVAEAVAGWQATVVGRIGEEGLSHFEAQLRGYELVRDAATDDWVFTEAWIRRLHEDLCAAQRTYQVFTEAVGWQDQQLPKGVYKEHPNHVRQADGSIHAYAPVASTPDEMTRLVAALNQLPASGLHPMVQAAFAHYSFVKIHPFADGNGRVARAIASVFLFQAYGVPLVLFVEDKDPYLDALEEADSGALQAFASFVSVAVGDSLLMVVEDAKALEVPAAGDTIATLSSLLTRQSGLTHQELDEVAQTLARGCHGAVSQQIAKLKLPGGTDVKVGLQQGRATAIEGFRGFLGGYFLSIVLDLSSSPPAPAQLSRVYTVMVAASDDDQPYDVLISDAHKRDELGFRIGAIHPSFTPRTTERIEKWAQQVVARGMAELLEAARQLLRDAGLA